MPLTFNQLTTHPKYLAETFENQSKLRQDWIKRDLVTNPKFKLLTPEEQKNTIGAAIFAAPSFADPQIGQQAQQLAQKVQAGDKQAKQQMENMVLTEIRRTSGAISRVAGDLASGVLKLFGADNVSTLSSHGNELDKHPEIAKMTSYFSSVLDQVDPDNNGFQALKGLNMFTSAMSDFVTISSMVGTSVTGAKGIGLLSKFAEKAVLKGGTTTGRMILGRLVGETAHASITSMLGVGREFAKEALIDQGSTNQDFQTILQKSARWFGEYFVGDLAVNWATSVMGPMIKIPFKKGAFFKGYGDVSQIYKSLNPEDWKNIVARTFAGDDIPTDMLSRMPKELQRETFSTAGAFKVLKHVENLSDIDAMKLVANSSGFNLLETSKGLEISPKGLDGKVKTFKNLKDVNDFMTTEMAKGKMNPIFKQADIAEFSKRAAASGDTEIKAIITGQVKPEASGNINVLTKLAAPVNGKFNKVKLNAFVKTYAKGNGAGDDIIKGLKVVETDDAFEVFAKEGKIGAVSKGALTPGDEALQLKVLTKKLSELTPNAKGVLVGEEFIKKYSKALVDQNIFTGEWMAHVVDLNNGKLFKQGNKWIIQSKVDPKVVQEFDSLAAVGENLIRNNVNIDMLKQSANRQGLHVVSTRSGMLRLKKEGKTIAEGTTPAELVDKVPEILPKIDSQLGPQLTLINDTGTLGVRFTKDSIAIGTHQKLLKFLDKFQKRSYGGSTFSLTGGSKGRIEFFSKRKQYDVVIDQLGERRTFEKISEARQYLDGGWKEMDNMAYTAQKKGYRLDYKAGKWFLYTDAGEKLMFNSFDEVTAAMKKVPVPEWAPELSGMTEELVDGLHRPPQDFFKIKEVELGEGPLNYSAQARAGQLWAPPKSVLEKFVSEGGDPAVLQMFNDIESARTFVIGREGAVRKVITTIFDNGSGKSFKKKTRLWIGEYAEAKDNVARALVIENAARDKVKMGVQELQSAERLRDFYGRTDQEGAFAYFKVDKEKFLKEYLPHIKADFLANPKKSFTDGKGSDYLASVFGNKTPKELDAFFKHSRTSDILDVAMEKDPMVQLLRYTNVGLKEKFLGPLIEQAKNLPAFKTDKVMQKRMFNYLSQIGGLPQGNAQEIIRSVTPMILKKFGISTSLTNDITSWFMSLGYSAAMGFRPWLPVRNMNQIWTTLAMRMQGNAWVTDALSDVSGPKGVQIFDTLRAKGVIASTLPLYGSEVLDQASFLSKITHKSLKMYKNSDDFTRAVAYQSATLKFNDAFKKIGSIDLAPEKFLRLSGVGQMDPTTRTTVMKLINEGNAAGARDMFATSIVTETMFPYRAGMGPLAFSGTLGKMFGMMGHYSAYYVDNIRRSLKYMTAGEKTLAGTIMVGNSMALYGAFRAIGVKADNFKPWEPAMFSGGPSWEIMQQMLNTVGGGPEGKQSRAALLGLKTVGGKLIFNPLNATLFKWTVPGAFALHQLKDAVNLSNDGDSYGAFLTSMGAPYSPDWEVLQ